VSSRKEQVYDFLTDPERLTSIFPDVSDIKVQDDNNFTLKAKVGVSFIRGTVDVSLSLVEKKPSIHARLNAKGSGMSSIIDMDTTFNLEDKGDGSLVKWNTEARVSGLMASVGARTMNTVADKYVREMVGSLQQKLSQ
jgi:carbon monoxide dehydrogenase subunit G